MNTKTKILVESLKLFNIYGSGNISTNHIAKAMEISPGNLYYHFKNKEAIIRGILEMMIKEYDAIYIDEIPQDEETILKRLVYDDKEISIKYRFLYNELNILFKRDKELEVLFVENQNKREKVFKKIFKVLQEKGILDKNIDEFVLDNVIKIIWYQENFRFFRYELENRKVEKVEDLNYDEILLERLIPLYGFLTEKGKRYFETEKYLK